MKQKLLLCLLTSLFINSTLIVFANSVENLLLISTSSQNLTTDDMNCTYTLASATTAATAWYKNNSSLMVLYMPMEGNEVNALLDYSGNANNGIKVGNPTWNANTGYDGNGAFQFDGASYIDAGNIMPPNAYTKSAWVRFTTGTLSNNIISGNNAGHAFFIVNDSGYRLEAGHNGVFNSVWDPAPFPENVWTFVTLTYDSSINNGTLILYKNSVEVKRAENIPPIANDARVLIGTYSAVNLFNGYIDDARIYNHSLTPEQISSLYNKGRDIIVATETKVGDEWQCNVTPFNSTDAGATYLSNILTIRSTGPQPSLSNIDLISTSSQNLTTDDLNCTYTLASATTAATAWYKNNSSLMVLYMPMEGNELNALLDYSGNANNGIKVGNPTWNANTGYDGNGAFQFDGASYIDAGFCMPAGAYTKSAWVRFTPGTLSNNIISGNSGGHAFFIINDSGYRLESGHNGTWNSVWDPNLFPENVWTFVAVTYDPLIDNGLLILYKNGVEVDREANIPPIANDARVLIGTYSAVNLFNGYIDDARIYNHSLTPEQISSLYNKGRDIIAATETKVGDEWQCRVTPFSSTEAGATQASNNLIINLIGKIGINLRKGWNLISIPLNLTNYTLPAPLSSISGKYSKIFTYNGGWVELENGTKINQTIGFWINMTNDDFLVIEGNPFENVEFNLNKGWNLIGYPYSAKKSVNEILNVSEINSVSVYTNSMWYSYNPTRPNNLNTLKQMEPGYGYWVNVK